MAENYSDFQDNELEDAPSGFRLQATSFDDRDTNGELTPPARSSISRSEALQYTQLVELADGQGSILFYPKQVELEVGDVLFLRERLPERSSENDKENAEIPDQSEENGVIVQIISLGTASYPQAITKALFRLMVSVRASVLERSHHEPPEVIDEFLVATFKVRASIVNGQWSSPEGRVVTRNVDVFILDPAILSEHILKKVDELNINLGDYKEESVEFFGGGFEKINLITGMKGSGKSHIAKGIISASVEAGMSAVVLDINNEYQHLPASYCFVPGQNLRFRLDRVQPRTFIEMVERLAPFAERTGLVAQAELPRIIDARANDPRHVPDLEYLRGQDINIFPGTGYVENMRASFRSSLQVVERYNLIMTEKDALAENNYLQSLNQGRNVTQPDVVSLRTVLYNIEHGHGAGVIIFHIGGLQPFVQYTVVDLIIDTLKNICRLQTEHYRARKINVPIYPTIYFEEAHMYMESKVINELLPLIRHHGMNVFFITNSPGALPDSVFRLMDNLIMTRMLNKQDIDQVKNCGLTDAETIEGFASNLREHHALLLSGINGATKNSPLDFSCARF